ncbi:futalosine hydrolase [Streptomyces sp. ME19-01-6]|uniref:futalosine hydrolase n=1 Tax=Streptomyces sp. ME19-01-6 TaxID=3028686 RepID=UPI0029BC112A|nr:futalosine hydrolase [Streptomyces sp. ME19-01-6]MDX3227316.1 futalosine hydrolase [Streptomyces sp. ME19-01-6]
MRVLVVTAVPAERDAVLRGVRSETAAGAEAEVSVPGGRTLHRVVRPPLTVDALAAGVGPAAAAAATATALTAAELGHAPYGLVVSAGIGGGFAPTPLGRVVVSEAIIAADLGAETPDGFAAVTDLGFGTVEHLPPPALVRALAEATGAVRGTVLTVSTVTGSAGRAAELRRRHPGAVAEAMEGFGVAEAAAAHGVSGVPVLELRAVSNAVGPRDRAAWRIGEALDALAGAFRHLPPALATWKGPSR